MGSLLLAAIYRPGKLKPGADQQSRKEDKHED